MKSSTVANPPTMRQAKRQLTALFERNGYVRWQNPDRIAEVGSQVYKKGDEVRLVAESDAELAHIQQLLEVRGFVSGRPFVKGKYQYCVPIYGREQVTRFLAVVGVSPA